MKKRLSFKESVYVASMLFGMFFGAGNLIFPVFMGQQAGYNFWPALIGFIVTGVGLPLLGVAALGISRSTGLYDLSSRVSRPYGLFFTCLLYLTIGPFFAIPRCATVSYTVGLERLLPSDSRIYLFIFSLLFFAAALFFVLRPGKILVWIGKLLNPFFLLFLGILTVVVLFSSKGSISEIEPLGAYATQPFFTGFLEGYNTMDALASLAFGIVVINVIKGLGINEPEDIATNTVRSGIFSCLLMAVIYLLVTLVGADSRNIMEAADNGGTALAYTAEHFLGRLGLIIMAITVTLACLKTAIGLITSCAETFSALFPNGPDYKLWAIIFSFASFLFANVGLSAIIAYAIPVLMFLYPLAVAIILLSLFGRFFGYDRRVFRWTIGFTLPFAVVDLVRSLPSGLLDALRLTDAVNAITLHLPLAQLGLSWLLPAILGLAIGLAIRAAKSVKA